MGADLIKVSIEKLDPWPRNPRGITKDGMGRLKRQLKRWNQYKPLVVKPAAEAGRFVVLGGNMRLEAMKELKWTEAWVSVVHPKTEAEEVEYSMSDNDRVGKYDREALAKIMLPHRAEIAVEDYQITLGDELSVPQLLKQYGPGVLVQEKEMDESIKTTHECKECGYRW